jgi:transcriptional regulator
MYVPRDFVDEDPERIRELIRRHAFGTLVTWDGRQPVASHLLMLLRDAPSAGPLALTLVGHMSRANPQWKSFDPAAEVLAIFQGPHAYVSAAWYSIPSAPTWNYVSAHVYGTPVIVDDRAELFQLLKALVDSQERASPENERYRLESMPDDLRESMMNAIVGFKISVTRVENAAKLSQNRGEQDHARIVSKLKERGDPDSLAVAGAMESFSSGRHTRRR